MKPSAKVKRAHRTARTARKGAYAPYSRFKVGAALISKAGRVFSGCNVENASYGGTVCAERVALLKAVSEGEDSFSDIVVVTDSSSPASPCGLCLQVMAEFFKPDARIWLGNAKGIQSSYTFSELLLLPFGPKQLSRSMRQ